MVSLLRIDLSCSAVSKALVRFFECTMLYVFAVKMNLSSVSLMMKQGCHFDRIHLAKTLHGICCIYN